MKEFMAEYFTEMKRESGFNETIGVEEDMPLLEQVMLSIKPNTNKQNFAKLLRKKDNIRKDMRNRAIARSIQQKSEAGIFKDIDNASYGKQTTNKAFSIRHGRPG